MKCDLKDEVNDMLGMGISPMAIAKELGMQLGDVMSINEPPKTLFGETRVDLVVPASIDVEDEPSIEDTLKTLVGDTALTAVKALQTAIATADDASELSKLTDSVTKLHSAFFKSDAATVVNIQTGQLAQFRSVLRD